MTNMAMSVDFLSAFARLPGAQQRNVRSLIARFSSNPTASGLNYERINGAKDTNMRPLRIDGSHRAIVYKPARGDIHMLLWADKHHEAYQWATRRRCDVNPETGAVQVYVPQDDGPAEAPQATAEHAGPSGPFAGLKDRELMRLGVPAAMLPEVRGITDECGLEAIEARLPAEAYEAPFYFLAGGSYEDLMREREAPATVDVDDYNVALQRPDSQMRFAVVADEMELEAMLNAPLERWRVFLHRFPAAHGGTRLELDATAIADPESYEAEDFRDKGLVIRRFKKDIRHEVEGAFQDRRIVSLEFAASHEEEAAYDALLAVQVANTPRAGGQANKAARDLFTVTLEKALFSSPAACIDTVDQRLRRSERKRELAGESNASIDEEVRTLNALREKLAAINALDFAKYQGLLAAIRGGHDAEESLRWRPNDAEDRLVVFTERIETLNWLAMHLAEDLKLPAKQIETLHGGMNDVEQQRVVEDFGNAAKPVRLLICSDVASEGINLHYHCHRLIHFDMPWSLMVFAQRNGRVDRYGQERMPQIVYLTTRSANEVILGDMRVLEVLKRKDEQAYRNIGDPSAFMKVHDIDEEEAITAKTIAGSTSADLFDADLTPTESEGDSLLALFTATPPADTASSVPESTKPTSLYANDLAYCEAALHRLRDKDRHLQFEVDALGQTLTLDAPEDLRHRFAHLSPEVAPQNWRFVLTTAKARMAEAIAASRRDERAWPGEHYLWRLNPVVEWLNDRMAAAFGRHEAPVLCGVPGLRSDETAFVLAGFVPNRRGHPLIHEWIVVCHGPDGFVAPQPFETLRHRTGLGTHPIPNRLDAVDVAALGRLLPEAVQMADVWFAKQRNDFEDAINAKLNEAIAALDALKIRRLRHVDEHIGGSAMTAARQDIDDIFGTYLQWIEDVMTTEERPWVSVVCIMAG